jgi:protein farnesyltransferase subunit beta
MYKWILLLKQWDGLFLVSHDTKIDVWSLYCLVTMALLNLLVPELPKGISEITSAKLLPTYYPTS